MRCVIIFLHVFDICSCAEDFIVFAANNNNFGVLIVVEVVKG